MVNCKYILRNLHFFLGTNFCIDQLVVCFVLLFVCFLSYVTLMCNSWTNCSMWHLDYICVIGAGYLFKMPFVLYCTNKGLVAELQKRFLNLWSKMILYLPKHIVLYLFGRFVWPILLMPLTTTKWCKLFVNWHIFHVKLLTVWNKSFKIKLVSSTQIVRLFLFCNQIISNFERNQTSWESLLF